MALAVTVPLTIGIMLVRAERVAIEARNDGVKAGQHDARQSMLAMQPRTPAPIVPVPVQVIEIKPAQAVEAPPAKKKPRPRKEPGFWEELFSIRW